MAKKNNYDNWTKEDLVKEVETLKKRKTYGLVWEEDKIKEVFDYYINWDGEGTKEKFGEEEGKFPVLKEVKNKSIDNKDPKYNLLIEGDNYHALAVLNFTHNKAIDVIYIDPPYNRGGDFKYNGKIIDKEDGYKHSKWLSFMSKRLSLAKNLLKDTGVIFISIDENEFAQLKILCDDIFGDNNFLGNLIWKRRGGIGSFAEKNLTQNHEYIMVYRKTKGFLHHNILGEKRKKQFKYEDKRGIYRWIELVGPSQQTKERRPNLDYGILYDGKNKKIVGFIGRNKKKEFFDKKISNNIKEIWLGGKATWLVGRPIIEKYYKRGLIQVFNEKNKLIVRIKNYLYNEKGELNGSILKSILSDNDVKIGMNTEGTKQIKEILYPKDYSNMKPKPLSLIQFLLSTKTNKNSIILDFFAGTGTTGHAVMELNKLDGGNRRYILCTNNEDNIAKDVCYPKLKKLIKGYKNILGEFDGYKNNLKYFKTDFVASVPIDQNKKKIVDKSTEMLCIKENAFKSIIDKKSYKIFKNSDIHLGIIFNDEQIDKFVEEAKNIKGKFHVYVFSFDDSVPKEEFKSMEGRIKLCPIPEVILHVYRRIFK